MREINGRSVSGKGLKNVMARCSPGRAQSSTCAEYFSVEQTKRRTADADETPTDG